MSPEDREALLDRKLAELAEVFDHVQILATWDSEGSTKTLKRGFGNWHARVGMAHEFIDWGRSYDAAKEIQKILPTDPPDDADQWKQ